MVVVVWQSEAASGWFSLIDGTMNSDLYQKILKKNLQPIVCALKLTWVMQQDKGPKRTSKKKKEQTNSGLHPPKNVMLSSCLENFGKMWLRCVFKESAIFHTGSDRSDPVWKLKPLKSECLNLLRLYLFNRELYFISNMQKWQICKTCLSF